MTTNTNEVTLDEQDITQEDLDLYDKIKRDFATLNLSFTMKTFKHCAEHGLDLNSYVDFNFTNLEVLTRLATPNLSADEADAILVRWHDEFKHDFLMLHILLIELAKTQGFFTSEKTHQAMGVMIQKNSKMHNVIQTLVWKEEMAVLGQQANLASLYE